MKAYSLPPWLLLFSCTAWTTADVNVVLDMKKKHFCDTKSGLLSGTHKRKNLAVHAGGVSYLFSVVFERQSLESAVIFVRLQCPFVRPHVWYLQTAMWETPEVSDSWKTASNTNSPYICYTCQITRISLFCELFPCSLIQRAHVTCTEVWVF